MCYKTAGTIIFTLLFMAMGCKKQDYDCATTITKVDKISDPVTGTFQLDGTAKCVVGVSYDSINGSLYKIETTCVKN